MLSAARLVPGLARRAAVQLREGREALGQAADDAQRERKPERPARTADSGVPPTATQTGSGSWSGRG